MKSRELIAKLNDGGRIYGTLIISTSPHWPAEVKKLGLDFVFLDTEHMSIDRDQLSWMCRTYSALQMAPIVRIPYPDPHQASIAMDAGASGIVAPYVETVQQVQALRGAVKLRPLKGQKLQRIIEGSEVPEPQLAEYLQDFNKENLLIVNIESQPALDALDDILAVPGLDGVLIGPHDLSVSLGVPEQYRHPLFVEAIETIIRKARAAGVAAGIHYFFGVDQEIEWGKLGMNLFIQASDMTAFVAQTARELREIKQALGDEVDDVRNKIHI